jgi:hypothetical protein
VSHLCRASYGNLALRESHLVCFEHGWDGLVGFGTNGKSGSHTSTTAHVRGTSMTGSHRMYSALSVRIGIAQNEGKGCKTWEWYDLIAKNCPKPALTLVERCRTPWKQYPILRWSSAF